MLPADTFCEELADRGFTLATGVPCSYFSGPIEVLGREQGRYVPAANEGGALAIAAGAALAGARAYVMLQNSGLGNLVNPLTSLVLTYQIPILAFVSLRGWPDPAGDEPQHQVMGPATAPLLDILGVPHQFLRAGEDLVRFREIIDSAEADLAAGRSSFVLVEKHSVGPATGDPAGAQQHGADSREVIAAITDAADGCPVIATTGYTSRQLFGIADAPANFYMQGSMGHASSFALGVALTAPGRPVVILDGDGAALMHLGAWSVIGSQAPANLIHVVLDNGIHESTGGQATSSSTTSFTAVALAAGYKTAVESATPDDAAQRVRTAAAEAGPHLIVVATAPATGPVPPRATSSLPAAALRDRFSGALRQSALPR